MKILHSKNSRIWLGKKIIYLPEVDSTNRWLLKSKIYREKNGTVVLAGIQNKGRGRHSRNWYSGSEDLCTSFSFHPTFNREYIPSISILVGLAIYRFLQNYSLKNISVKWPNDILVDGKKIAGILCEIIWNEEKPIIIIGIGLNLKGFPSTFPDEIREKVTTIENEIGEVLDKFSALEALLDELENILSLEGKNIPGELWREWEEKSSSIGKKITFELNGKLASGMIMSLSELGRLKVLTEGREIELNSGEIFFND